MSSPRAWYVWEMIGVPLFQSFTAAMDPVTVGIRRVFLHPTLPNCSSRSSIAWRESARSDPNARLSADLHHSLDLPAALFQTLHSCDSIDFCFTFQALTSCCFSVPSRTESWWSKNFSITDIVSELNVESLFLGKPHRPLPKMTSQHPHDTWHDCSLYHGTERHRPIERLAPTTHSCRWESSLDTCHLINLLGWFAPSFAWVIPLADVPFSLRSTRNDLLFQYSPWLHDTTSLELFVDDPSREHHDLPASQVASQTQVLLNRPTSLPQTLTWRSGSIVRGSALINVTIWIRSRTQHWSFLSSTQTSLQYSWTVTFSSTLSMQPLCTRSQRFVTQSSPASILRLGRVDWGAVRQSELRSLALWLSFKTQVTTWLLHDRLLLFGSVHVHFDTDLSVVRKERCTVPLSVLWATVVSLAFSTAPWLASFSPTLVVVQVLSSPWTRFLFEQNTLSHWATATVNGLSEWPCLTPIFALDNARLPSLLHNRGTLPFFPFFLPFLIFWGPLFRHDSLKIQDPAAVPPDPPPPPVQLPPLRGTLFGPQLGPWATTLETHACQKKTEQWKNMAKRWLKSPNREGSLLGAGRGLRCLVRWNTHACSWHAIPSIRVHLCSQTSVSEWVINAGTCRAVANARNSATSSLFHVPSRWQPPRVDTALKSAVEDTLFHREHRVGFTRGI